eukprot:825108-Rhodomonas_salina.2
MDEVSPKMDAKLTVTGADSGGAVQGAGGQGRGPLLQSQLQAGAESPMSSTSPNLRFPAPIRPSWLPTRPKGTVSAKLV